MTIKNKKVIDRFMSKVKKIPKGCWEWTAGKQLSKWPYGRFKYKGKTIYAHRVSYMIFLGSIKKGMFVCHTCDNPSCVNPKHLWLGTNSENMLDSVRKGRHAAQLYPLEFAKRFKKGLKDER